MRKRVRAGAGRLLVLVSIVVFAIAAALVVVGHAQFWKGARPVAGLGDTTAGLMPHSLGELLATPPERIQQMDVALMNLLCVEGLPGTEGLDVSQCLSILDQWTERIGAKMARKSTSSKRKERRSGRGWLVVNSERIATAEPTHSTE